MDDIVDLISTYQRSGDGLRWSAEMISYHLRRDVSEELEELVESGVLEFVDGEYLVKG